MKLVGTARAWWWLVHKDLMREWRAPRALSGMLLLGILLAALLVMQVDLPAEQRASVVSGLFWFAALFAGVVAFERSFAGERDEGCWQALLLYPIAPAAIFFAKLTVNFLALSGLAAVLVPAFAAFSGVSFGGQRTELLWVLCLTNLGFSVGGTVLGALTNSLRHRSALLVLLLLPLVSPMLLGASQASRLLLADQMGAELSRWLQLLVAFDALYVAIGALLFEFVIED